MKPLKNDRLLRAIHHQPVDCTPIWIMRQAGRYLPEYRATRAQAKDFLTLCKTPELACEVTLQPLRRFDLDAAILFSDILTIPDAMGLGLQFVDGEGPRFLNPVRDEAAIKNLLIPDPENELRYVMDAVRLIKQELADKVPLIGFSGSPWTLASYMVEGSSSKDFHKIKKLMYENPVLLHQLLNKLADAVISYLSAQIAAGVDVVMLFDTWGGVLTSSCYHDFSLHYLQKIVSALKQNNSVPIILFTKGGGLWLEKIAATGCDVVGVDWTINLMDVRQRIGKQVAIQGNMDPAVLLSSPQQIRAEVTKILKSYGEGSGHIFNLGHGITPDVPPEHVAVLVDAVHEQSIPS